MSTPCEGFILLSRRQQIKHRPFLILTILETQFIPLLRQLQSEGDY